MSELINQIKRHEGLRLKPYRCTAGKITIGYGRNLEDKGISEVEAEHMLLSDINDVRVSLINRLWFFNNIDQVRQDVLINMAFNMGVDGLLKFKKMLAAMESGDFTLASKEMLDSKWSRQVIYRAYELSEQMKNGSY